MKRYLVKDINQAYTDVITEYLQKGYTVFTNTMGGSQGEKANLHLMAPDMKTVLRVTLDRFSDWKQGADGYEINVREYPTTILHYMHDLDGMGDILWERSGEIIVTQRFYQISNYKKNCYGDQEFFEVKKQKHAERYQRREAASEFLPNTVRIDITSPKVIKTILPWVRRQYKCTSTLPRDIGAVYKCLNYSYNKQNELTVTPEYRVHLKNKVLTLATSKTR